MKFSLLAAAIFQFLTLPATLAIEPMRPVNDNFTDASMVHQTNGFLNAFGTTMAATREPNEPLNTNGFASVWFKWIPDTTSLVEVSIGFGQAEAWLFRSTGESVADLTRMGGAGVLPLVNAGETYYVGVYSKLNEGSFFSLVLRPIQANPANDAFSSATEISLTNDVATVIGTTRGATLETGEPGIGDSSVWYRFVATNSMEIAWAVEAGTGSASLYRGTDLASLTPVLGNSLEGGENYYFRLATYFGNTGPFRFVVTRRAPDAGPVNDYFANATVLYGSKHFLTGDFSGATTEQGDHDLANRGGFPIPERTLWWRYDVEQNGRLLAFTDPMRVPAFVVWRGTFMGSLQLAPNVLLTIPNLGGEGFLGTVSAGDTIYFQVQAPENDAYFKGVYVQFSAGIPNDDFEHATPIDHTAPDISRLIQNFGATAQPGENIATNGTGQTVWFSWKAPYEGRFFFVGTPGALFQLYQGTALTNLVRIPPPVPETVGNHTGFVPMDEGEQFFLQVDSDALDAGWLGIRVFVESAHATNDAFSDAITWPNSHDIRGAAPLKYATREPNEPAHVSYPHKTLWWRWTADLSGPCSIEGKWGTNFAAVAIYVGDSVDQLELVGKSDGTVNTRVRGGVTYHVAFSVPADAEGTMFAFGLVHAEVDNDEVPGNIVLNGSFESSLDPWIVSGPVEMEIFGGVPPKGSRFARLLTGPSSIEQTISTEPGRRYELQFAYHLPFQTASTRARLRLLWNGQELRTYDPATPYQWHWVKHTLLADSETATLRFENLEGPIELDAISVALENKAAPTIVVPPQSKRLLAGETLYLDVQADGPSPMFYKWFRDGVRLTNEQTAALAIPNVTPLDSGHYHVVVSNPGGAIESTNALVEVLQMTNTVIFVQPVSAAAIEGEYLALSVFAAGPAPLTYQWEKDGVPLTGETNADLVFPSLSLTNAGTYRVQVSSPGGLVLSDSATLQVDPNGVHLDGLLVDFTYYSKVYDVDGANALAGGRYVSQLFFGTSPDDLRPFEQPVPFADGIFAGMPVGTKSPANLLLHWIPTNSVAYFQMRVWERKYGATYEHARAAGGNYGQTPVEVVPRVQWGQDNWTIIEVASFNVRPGARSFALPGLEKVPQAIDFPEIGDQEYSGAPVPLTAEANSGLPVQFSITFGPAVITNHLLVVTTPGAIGVKASQPGNPNFFPAEDVVQTFEVRRGSQSIDFAPISTNGTPRLDAISSAGLEVTFEIVEGNARIVGQTLTEIGVGPVTIRAKQPGNTFYEAAQPVDQTIVFQALPQTISFPEIPDVVLTNETQLQGFAAKHLTASQSIPSNLVPLVALASSGLPVTYAVISGPAVVNGDLLTVIDGGEILVRAVQSGDTFFSEATAEQSFHVFAPEKLPQTISFELPGVIPFPSAPIPLLASASSGLPVTFILVSGPGRIVQGQLVADAAGTLVLEARQVGDTRYQAALVTHTIRFIQPPEITLSTGENGLTLSWQVSDGTSLESAPSPTGPWEKVPEVSAEGEFSLPRHPESQARFYRLTIGSQ